MAKKTYFSVLLLLTFTFSSAVKAEETRPTPLFIIHFETGEHWNQALAPAEQKQFKEHSANLNRLREEGVILFGARYGELGLIILHAESLEAAQSLMDADPGVQAGIFNYRLEALRVFYPWKSP